MCVVQLRSLSSLVALVDVHCDELKLENAASFILLAPAIDEVKIAVVSPDARQQLLVNSDDVRPFLAGFELLSGPSKLSVFRRPTGRQKLWLIDDFRNGCVRSLWHIPWPS